MGIATRGRASILAETLAELRHQTSRPERIIVCACCEADVAGITDASELEIIFSKPGLPRQRNTIMARTTDCDILLFLDDDFVMAPAYVAATRAAFGDAGIVVTTGSLIADGVKGPGIAIDDARSMILSDTPSLGESAPDAVDTPHGYGCNMAICLATARRHGVLFDERLPLYAWSEDVDYTHRLGRHGRIVKLRRARGVHLGTKAARSPGHKLGYSQVANPLYLRGKGSYSWGRALRSVGRNLAANLARWPKPEAWVDRRGRLRGNMLALSDMLRGRLTPERVLEL